MGWGSPRYNFPTFPKILGGLWRKLTWRARRASLVLRRPSIIYHVAPESEDGGLQVSSHPRQDIPSMSCDIVLYTPGSRGPQGPSAHHGVPQGVPQGPQPCFLYGQRCTAAMMRYVIVLSCLSYFILSCLVLSGGARNERPLRALNGRSFKGAPLGHWAPPWSIGSPIGPPPHRGTKVRPR